MDLSPTPQLPLRTVALACPSCAAPLPPGTPVGSVFHCEYCGHSGLLEGVASAPHPAPRPPEPPADYLCLRTPPELSRVRFNPPEGIPALREAWSQALHRAANGSGSHYAAYFAASWLAYALWLKGDKAQRRQVLESTLQSLQEPGYRAGLLCLLARDAALEKDAARARTLLGQCPEVSDGVLLRFRQLADATVAWALGRWPEAIGLLDEHLELRHSPLGRFAVELKIDCLEKLGRDADALAAFKSWSAQARAEGLTLADSLKLNGLGFRTLRNGDAKRARVWRVVIGALLVPVALLASLILLARSVS